MRRTQGSRDAGLSSRYPSRPPGLPFRWDTETISHGLSFTLTTSLGDIDLLAGATGGGGYQEFLAHSGAVEHRARLDTGVEKVHQGALCRFWQPCATWGYVYRVEKVQSPVLW